MLLIVFALLLLLLYCRDVSRWQLAQLCYQTALKLQEDPAVQVKTDRRCSGPNRGPHDACCRHNTVSVAAKHSTAQHSPSVDQVELVSLANDTTTHA